jgi:hypothetical protein
MAIDASLGNPIIVTGTTNTNDKVIDKGVGGAVFIKFIKWHKPTTIGHLVALKDSNGREIALFDCEVAKESQWAPIWSYFQNIYCDNMDSGKLYIYTR